MSSVRIWLEFIGVSLQLNIRNGAPLHLTSTRSMSVAIIERDERVWEVKGV